MVLDEKIDTETKYIYWLYLKMFLKTIPKVFEVTKQIVLYDTFLQLFGIIFH